MPNIFKRLLNSFSGGKKDKKEMKQPDEWDNEVERRKQVHFGKFQLRVYDAPPNVSSHRKRQQSMHSAKDFSIQEEDEEFDDQNARFNKTADAEHYKKRGSRRDRFHSLRRPHRSFERYAAAPDDEDYGYLEGLSKTERIRDLERQLAMARGEIDRKNVYLQGEYMRRREVEWRLQEHMRMQQQFPVPTFPLGPGFPDSPESMRGAGEVNTGMLYDDKSGLNTGMVYDDDRSNV
ncbi:hypothetical protein L596_008880 [Steinernema carpocapsae]|uniref:Uncharacterized protein n=1 Tax=Steinernema carpocapsae TaxID=34508 RepID=A0A4U5PDR7_STECR|nr:hypothetical protein L596_008880 [Steinernema carpocapsae]